MPAPGNTPQPKIAYEFIDLLFPGGIPQDHYICLWSNPGKQSAWLNETGRAALDFYVKAQAEANVYIGAGLSKTDNGPNRRVTKNAVAGIPGLWADIDVSGPGHKESRKPLPETFDKALNLLRAACGDTPPTVIVHSGGGLQAWWLFSEPWLFSGDAERELAQQIAQAWNDRLRSYFHDQGYDLDSTWDLSRVMRLPGTLNVKAIPTLVRILDASGPRHGSGAKFAQGKALDLSSQPAGASTAKPSRKSKPFTEYPKLDQVQVQLLWEVDTQAFRAWNGDPCPWLTDQSDSARDLSIASRCAIGGWEKDDIKSLLLQGRKKRGADLKRPDYYDRTVDAAFRFNTGSPIEKAAIEITVRDGGDPDPQAKPESLMKAINAQLGLGDNGITAIRKLTGEPPTFTVHFGTSIVNLGDSGGLLDQGRFRRAVANELGVVVKRRKADQWDSIVQVLLNLTQTVQGGRARYDLTLLEDNLSDYLEAQNIDADTGEAWEDRASTHAPFKEGGKVHFSLNGAQGLTNWLTVNRHMQLEQKSLAGMLRMLGWEHERRVIRQGAATFTRNLWSRRAAK